MLLLGRVGHRQGGESRDFLQLCCTCIPTDRIQKLFIIFLFLNNFSCCKVKKKTCNYLQRRNI